LSFSSRFPSDLSPNPLALALERLKANGETIIDLTASNPTRAGLSYPPDLLEPLSDPRGLVYAPQPFGLPDAREAVAADFARRGLVVAADDIALTASTSEAYSLVFKVLCDAGDEVLVPRPSYPLFEHLTRLDLVVAVPYDLEYQAAWTLDLASLERGVTSRTRAILLVNPNNPTGNFTAPNQLEQVVDLAAARNLAIVSDEVFADYAFEPRGATTPSLTERTNALAFTLGGLSKTIGLPQAKLGWIALGGPSAAVREARSRVELACDTYLSVSTSVQTAVSELLRRGATVRRQIQERVRINYAALRSAVGRTPSCELLHAEGGWYAVVRVPSLVSEENLVLSLLTEDRVLVHPGYFFDFPHETFLVLSLLPPEAVFTDGVARILQRFAHSVDRS
jgi:aspartate/methionine/tyrosine aminotransferase